MPSPQKRQSHRLGTEFGQGCPDPRPVAILQRSVCFQRRGPGGTCGSGKPHLYGKQGLDNGAYAGE
jgi:hypothetical protein